MSLQWALLLLGVGGLGLIILFSLLHGRVKPAHDYYRIGKIFRKLKIWSRGASKVRSLQREPSFVSANHFHLDIAPGAREKENFRFSTERKTEKGVFSTIKRKFEYDFPQPLKLDYWGMVSGPDPVMFDDVMSIYRRHEAELGHAHAIHGRRYPGESWANLEDSSSTDRFTDLIVSVQMVDRKGPITESELTRTNNLIYELTEEFDRTFTFDSTVEEALRHAVHLDHFCQHYDVLVIINVVAEEGSIFSGDDIRSITTSFGMEIGDMGMYHYLATDSGSIRFTMANRFEPGSFDFDSDEPFVTNSLTLFMSVPHVIDPLNGFGDMLSVAEYVVSEWSATIQDPDGRGINQSGIEKIRQEINDIEEAFTRAGIDPGSEDALRLF